MGCRVSAVWQLGKWVYKVSRELAYPPTQTCDYQQPHFVPNTSNSHSNPSYGHVGLLPSAGIGHLTPFLRLAALLVRNGCRVTLISTDQTVSTAESQLISRFLSAFPQVEQKRFNILPLDPSTVASTDPFWLQWEAIRRSSHLLSSILSSLSPTLSALISDLSLISSALPVAKNFSLPNYVFFPSSARMFSLFASFPSIVAPSIDAESSRQSDVIELPGLSSIPKSSIPPLLFNPDSYFRSLFSEDSRQIAKLDGILINTFEGLEAKCLHALGAGEVIDGLPPLFAVGPLVPCEFEKGEKNAPMKWLGDQPAESVVYVCFGSRTPLSREQIREVGDGLLRSGCKFLWVVKDKTVDKEDEEGLAAVLGHDLAHRIKDKGFVVKDWVEQGEILGHRAVGGFVSHCGWNSVVEASWHGVPLLAWPQNGDQKINAEVVETSGLGMWVKSWGWGGDVLVKGEEIGERIKELMRSDELRLKATQVREKARRAVGDVGSSDEKLKTLIDNWNKLNGST